MITKLTTTAATLAAVLTAGILTPEAGSAQEDVATAEITPDSLRLLVAAAVQGYAEAQNSLGDYIYRYGNDTEAVRRYRAAERQIRGGGGGNQGGV